MDIGPAARVRHYLSNRKRMSGIDRDRVHSVGEYPGGDLLHLTVADLEALIGQSLAAHARVASMEREYVNAINAILAAAPDSSDVDRWRGHAEARRQEAAALRQALGMPQVNHSSREWRMANGVYSDAYVASLHRREASEAERPESVDLYELIADFLDPDECDLDHHGYCQAHTWFDADTACPHRRARALLGGLKA